jgi:membrane-associated phospholipid phosphatase
MFLTASGSPSSAFFQALVELCTPGGLLGKNAAHVYLTKDLFFSGHTGVTFLLLLYVWPYRRLRWLMLTGHVLVVLSVLLSHLHYTIDIVGAYAIAFSLYTLREGLMPWRRASAAG